MKRSAGTWSLFRHLILGFGISLLALVLFSHLSLYYLLVRGLESERNAILEDKIDAIAALLRSPAHGLEEIHRRVESEWPLRGGEHVFLEIRDGNGALVAQTPHVLHGVFAHFPNSNFSGPLRFTGDDDASFLARVYSSENAVGLPSPVTIHAAIGEEESKSFLESFRGTMVAVGLFTVGISLLAGWFLARKGLRPLEEITKTVSGMGPRNLAKRVELESLPRELRSLATAFNETFDHLQEAFERLSRFSSDIAHELRTPIANITGEVELALTRPRSSEEYEEVLSSVLEECGRIMRMTDSLLFLARAENLKKEWKREPLLLRGLIGEIVEFYEAPAAEKGQRLSFEEPEHRGLSVFGDSVLFQRAVGNLVANAIQYTPREGNIRVSYGEENDVLKVTVADNGPGIPPEALPRIFDRFYRVDPSRSLESGGFGLGLAIAKSIVELHGGSIAVHSSDGEGTKFTLEIPKALLYSSHGG